MKSLPMYPIGFKVIGYIVIYILPMLVIVSWSASF